MRNVFVIVLISCLFGQDNENEIEKDMNSIGLGNFINLGNTVKPFLNDSSNYGQHQRISMGFGIIKGVPLRVHSYSNTVYYKINDRMIADANYTLSNVRGSQYTEKYGYQLLNDINGAFDAGVRYYPFRNSFFNIDTRTYNSPGGNGTSVDLDFMGLTLKRLFKKGNIDDNFSVFD